MEFKTKKFADLSFGNYLSYNCQYSFNHIIDQRMPEILKYFSSENECKKYILSNELYIYTYEEEYYDKFIFMVKQIYGFYDINLNVVFKNSEEELIEYLKDKINKNEMPKFDYIIQNPPYNGSMHLDFFKLGLKSLKENGKMIIIEPSQWLTNLRHTNKLSEKIKEKISNHVKSVTIENLNEEFNIANFTPLTITKIDLENIFKNIDFKCCGEEKIITNLNDANLIGNYKIIKSILDKCTKLDIIKNHSTNKKLDNKSIFYLRYSSIITKHGYFSKDDYLQHKCGTYYCMYIIPTLHKKDRNIYDYVPETKSKNKNPSLCVYGTKEELENYKYYILNNKLPLFINICMTIDQNNNSKNYVPWIVDKKYSDEEIYKKLDLNQEEIDLIDKTIKKYEINSPWFKRYINGKTEDVNDQVIKEFIKNI